MSKELAKLLEAARTHKVTPEEREEQLVSFVWGNAPDEAKYTRKSVRLSLNLRAAEKGQK